MLGVARNTTIRRVYSLPSRRETGKRRRIDVAGVFVDDRFHAAELQIRIADHTEPSGGEDQKNAKEKRGQPAHTFTISDGFG